MIIIELLPYLLHRTFGELAAHVPATPSSLNALGGALSSSHIPTVVQPLLPSWFQRIGREDRLILASTGFISTLLVTLTASTHRLGTVLSRSAAASRDRALLHRAAQSLASQGIARCDSIAALNASGDYQILEARLQHLITHDDLTGALNRRHFTRELEQLQQGPCAHDTCERAILSLNLDNFKSVTDALGYQLSDALLHEIANRITHCMRAGDIFARIDGDEFALLLSDLRSMDHALRITQHILYEIEQPFTLGGIRVTVTASAGLCQFGLNGTKVEDTLRNAVLGMSQAKQQGGGRCVTYDGTIRQVEFANMQLKRQMQDALVNEEFRVFYMPLVDLLTETICGVEALIRWQHPVRGLLAPGEFIALAEETGLIVDLGAWTMRQACKDYWELQKNSRVPLLLSVNVSGLQLDKEDFMSLLTETLDTYRIDPRRLQLEIIESIFLSDADRIGQLFSQIRALGIKIALDDFGTGYSSLSYLAKYPIDTLKVDQSFVRRMTPGSVDADIVQLVIKLAQATGMHVSAEGIEHPRQAMDLLEYGCPVAQGYLYSRPVDLTTITTIIRRGLNPERAPK